MKSEKQTTTNQTIYNRYVRFYYDSLYDESERFIINKIKRGYAGYRTKRGLYPAEARMYKTWKHNRKTQYK